MGTIDLGPPPPAPQDLLDGLPRRVALTLPELRLVARHAGDAPLPFETDQSGPGGGSLHGRLGASPRDADRMAYAAALRALHDPVASLSRRGLLVGGPDDGVVEQGLVGAVGLLATPAVAVDIDVVAGTSQVRSWHRQSGGAVAALSTQDGVVFELAWFPTWAWGAELARVAVLPEDLPLRDSLVPDRLDLPHQLADAAFEAVRGHRSDLVPILIGQQPGAVVDAHGSPMTDRDAAEVLVALGREARGRLRALVAQVDSDTSGRPDPVTIGVLAWTLVADGWRALRPRNDDDQLRLEIARVIPEDLAVELAPVLAEVRGGLR